MSNHPTLLLRNTIANHFNRQSHPSTTATATTNYLHPYTTPDHVCVAPHARSLVFLLHLAVDTYNTHLASTTPRVCLVASPSPAAGAGAGGGGTPTLCLPLCRLPFPQAAADDQRVLHQPQPVLCLVEMRDLRADAQPVHCACLVFPQDPPRGPWRSALAGLLLVMAELQDEVGVHVPTSALEQAQLAFAPWTLAYDRKRRAWTTGWVRHLVLPTLRSSVVSAGARADAAQAWGVRERCAWEVPISDVPVGPACGDAVVPVHVPYAACVVLECPSSATARRLCDPTVTTPPTGVLLVGMTTRDGRRSPCAVLCLVALGAAVDVRAAVLALPEEPRTLATWARDPEGVSALSSKVVSAEATAAVRAAGVWLAAVVAGLVARE